MDIGNAIYVIYTSGSTGRPKGVVNTHSGLCNRLRWMQQIYPLSAQDCVLQKTSSVFDVSVWEFLWPLVVGARLVLAQPHRQGDSEYLSELISKERITTAHFVPSMLAQWLDDPEAANCRGLKRVIASVEELPLSLQKRFYEMLPDCELHNLYGPTEASIDVTAWPCDRTQESGPVPIGRPIANTQMYVLDEGMQAVPVGVAGELYIGGAGLARGYLNRPGLTAERFVPDPLSGNRGARLYRTGDIGRWLPEGQLEYLGRRDDQVKIRGYRIELGEAEALLRGCAGVRDAVVLALGEGAERRLAGYVQWEGEPLSWTELRRRMLERAPEYMVPQSWVAVEQWPLTVNGKLDRRALPAPEAGRDESLEYVAPRTPTEEILAGIWQQVLGVQRVGIHDNFFALGGDSIQSLQVVAIARDKGLQLNVQQLFLHQSISSLAAEASPLAKRVQRHSLDRKKIIPLTPTQHWFFEQAFEHPEHWNQSVFFEIPRTVTPEILESAIRYLIDHHDVFSLAFVSRANGQYKQQYKAHASDLLPFRRYDFSGLAEEAQLTALKYETSLLQAAMDFSAPPLLQAGWFDLGNRGCRLFFAIHHLLIDGVSWRILLRDLQTLSRQFVLGEELNLLPPSNTFADWADTLTEYTASSDMMTELPFWRRLSEYPHQPLWPDLARRKNSEASRSFETITLPSEETDLLLRQVLPHCHAVIDEVLLAALSRALNRLYGARTILMDLESHGRQLSINDLDLSGTIGWFTALYPVSLTVAEGDPIAHLSSVKQRLRAIPQNGIGYGILRFLHPLEG